MYDSFTRDNPNGDIKIKPAVKYYIIFFTTSNPGINGNRELRIKDVMTNAVSISKKIRRTIIMERGKLLHPRMP